jgi:hypothetical protein
MWLKSSKRSRAKCLCSEKSSCVRAWHNLVDLNLKKDRYDTAPALLTSKMFTKASNPTVSKLDAAQQDRPTADDQEGNLSKKQVDERFKALPGNTSLLFEKLKTEFETRYIGSVSDILEWNAYLTKTLEKPNLVDLFTKWTFFRRPEPKDDLRTIDLEEFRKHLAATNWKFKNEDYDRVFDLMWNSRGNNPSKFLLKQLNDNFLAVAVDPRCLTPRDPLHDSLEAYDIVDSNLFNILGLRYRKDGVTKEMIIAPFGMLPCFLAYLRNGRVTKTHRTNSILYAS